MRITEFERQAIKNAVFSIDPHAQVFLFGSRVSDEKKGGDIDLLVLSSDIDREQIRKIKIELYDQIGEQKIDILLAPDTDDPFVEIALERALLL